jgi:N-methylhydantoinase B/oxoprolinase/acetone carboxylase alpha subunit
MSASIKAGDMVKWKWGGGEGRGKVVKRYTRKITLTLKGSEVTREASEDAPALRIEQADGDVVLKSASEVDKV